MGYPGRKSKKKRVGAEPPVSGKGSGWIDDGGRGPPSSVLRELFPTVVLAYHHHPLWRALSPTLSLPFLLSNFGVRETAKL